MSPCEGLMSVECRRARGFESAAHSSDVVSTILPDGNWPKRLWEEVKGMGVLYNAESSLMNIWLGKDSSLELLTVTKSFHWFPLWVMLKMESLQFRWKDWSLLPVKYNARKILKKHCIVADISHIPLFSHPVLSWKQILTSEYKTAFTKVTHPFLLLLSRVLLKRQLELCKSVTLRLGQHIRTVDRDPLNSVTLLPWFSIVNALSHFDCPPWRHTKNFNTVSSFTHWWRSISSNRGFSFCPKNTSAWSQGFRIKHINFRLVDD